MIKVFLVDDDKILLPMLKYGLEEAGNSVETSSSIDAYQRICETLPDVIVLDVMMPVIDGISLCQMLRTNPSTQNIPTIFLTSAVTEENKAQAAFLGVMHMLQKPVEISRLATVIQQEDALHQIKATWTNTDTVLSELLQRYPNATDEDAEICT
ncbi:MAG: putative response regulator receiver domain protein [Prokaryotic dsDNA virus sp.]|nr:MAG: putative response regulator receiver domain protein [Prokaryotic dsDNA virus sp.]|tara:strand:- start:4701 stop:5162 length:462 start_codon:yes stop_codon:yes gene_type:complete